MAVVFGWIPEMVWMIARVHHYQGFVELCLEGYHWNLIGNVSERVFQLSCYLMNSTQACNRDESQKRTQHYAVCILVHQEGNSWDRNDDKNHGNLRVWEGERNKHNLSRVVVKNHAVTQKLNDTRNNGRTNLTGGSIQMLANDKFSQPVPAQLCLC